MQINPLDFSTSTFNTGGSWMPDQSGIRVTHIASGEYVECSEHRGQHANRWAAFAELIKILQLDKQLELDF